MIELTNDELLERGRDLARAIQDYHNAAADRKQMMDETKAEMEAIQQRIDIIKDEINTGHKHEEPQMELDIVD